MPKANEFYFLSGKTKWFRPDTPNQWGKWSHVLYPDPPSLEIVRKLMEPTDSLAGIKNVLQKDDDGYFLYIGRKTKIEPRAGTPIPLRPPEIYDKDGKTPLRGVYVGNGSDVTTKVNVYSHSMPTGAGGKKGRAMRWESSRIDHLVPYDAPRDEPGNVYKDPKRGYDTHPSEEVAF